MSIPQAITGAANRLAGAINEKKRKQRLQHILDNLDAVMAAHPAARVMLQQLMADIQVDVTVDEVEVFIQTAFDRLTTRTKNPLSPEEAIRTIHNLLQ